MGGGWSLAGRNSGTRLSSRQAAVGGWRARGETSVSGRGESQSLNLGVQGWAWVSGSQRFLIPTRPGLHACAGTELRSQAPAHPFSLLPGPLPITMEAQWAVLPRQGGMDPCYGASLLLVKRLVPLPACGEGLAGIPGGVRGGVWGRSRQGERHGGPTGIISQWPPALAPSPICPCLPPCSAHALHTCAKPCKGGACLPLTHGVQRLGKDFPVI